MANPSAVPTAILILRAWMEGDPPSALRVRLTTTTGVADSESSLAVVATVDGACDAVGRWLSDFIASLGGGTAA